MTQEDQAAEPKTEAAEAKEGIEDPEAIKKELADEKAKAEANLAGWQRAQADFINYKRRCEQEKTDAGKSANAELLVKLLPIVDDLELALTNIPPEVAEQRWVDGIRLIERKWRSCFEAQGVTPIKALGEPFDPRLHEALKQDRGKEGIVILEIQKGYTLGDRILRPSKVIVGNGEQEEQPEGYGPAEQEDTEKEN